MKVKTYRNGWSVVMDKGYALYSVILRNSSGEIHDKMRCDYHRDALEWYRAFSAIAKNA